MIKQSSAFFVYFYMKRFVEIKECEHVVKTIEMEFPIFISILNSDGSEDSYNIIDFDKFYRIKKFNDNKYDFEYVDNSGISVFSNGLLSYNLIEPQINRLGINLNNYKQIFYKMIEKMYFSMNV
jgi:hypothetical protein